jgi:hypothetical protein
MCRKDDRFFNMNHLKMFDFAALFKPITDRIIGNTRETAYTNNRFDGTPKNVPPLFSIFIFHAPS